MKELTERGKYWEAIVQEQVDSGLSVSAFCKQRQLTPCSFYWWRRELQGLNKPRQRKKKKRQSQTGFVEVVTPDKAGGRNAGVMLQLDERISILLDRDFDRDVLSAVLVLLRDLPHCSR